MVLGGGIKMESFFGHIFTGFTVTLAATAMTWTLLTKWHRSRFDPNSPPFLCTIRCFPWRRPWEAYLVAMAALLIVLQSTVKGMGEHWWFFKMENAEHTCILAGFIIVALTVICTEHKFHLPPHSDHAALILALVARWLFLADHWHDAPPGVMLMHRLQKNVVAAGILALVIEIFTKSQVSSGLFRSYCLFLQGTWLCQLGYAIYSPWENDWDLASDQHLPVITVVFIAHLFFGFLITMGLNCLVIKLQEVEYRRKSYILDALKVQSEKVPLINGENQVIKKDFMSLAVVLGLCFFLIAYRALVALKVLQ
ncbi:unnamed protein product [Darwinula stevensoni]|uniref:Uncharacterized protein n=1 Tax=Darwinula stevensoni TaxID=69355 RepID=A0A7R8XBM5_9CRUS|nr:unnamed protein product [Darwinula stevensoni]CAG0891363.1 unnamed protein product [Darwinula stevensoni]